MKKRLLIIASLFIIFAVSSMASLRVNAITPTYTVTQTSLSIYGQPWVFQISTNDPAVKQVTVTWLYSTPPPLAVLGTTFQIDQFTITGPFSFSDQITPTNIGTHWAIVVQFKDSTGNIIHVESHEEEFAPPNRVPEVPLVGTIGAATAMLLATAFYFKQKHPSLKK